MKENGLSCCLFAKKSTELLFQCIQNNSLQEKEGKAKSCKQAALLYQMASALTCPSRHIHHTRASNQTAAQQMSPCQNK